MDFPNFDGKSDPLPFINQCESYFLQQRIMEEEKAWVASRNLKDGARMWFRQVLQDEGTPAWRRFTELLHLRFGSLPCSNLLHHVSPAADNTLRILADMSTLLDRLKALLKAKEERERLAVVRLQAAARGLLACRRVQSLRGEKRLAVISRSITWPSSEEQAAVRLQAAGRGFLVRLVVRKMCMLLSSSLQFAFSHSGSPIHPVAPIEVEVQGWGLLVQRMTSATQQEAQQQASTAVAVSFVLAPALVLDRSSVRVGWYILQSSFDMKPAVRLFPWDPGGHSCSPNLFHILVPNLFHILVLNNKGKPRCKRLNPRSRQLGLRQLVGD